MRDSVATITTTRPTKTGHDDKKFSSTHCITTKKIPRSAFLNNTGTILPTTIYTHVYDWLFLMKPEKGRADSECAVLRSFKLRIEHAQSNQSTGRHYERDDRFSGSGRGYGDTIHNDRNRCSANRHHNYGYNDRRTNNRRNSNHRGRRVNYSRSRSPLPQKDSEYDYFLRWKGGRKSHRAGKRTPLLIF